MHSFSLSRKPHGVLMYSYGSERNRGSVIAQLVRGDGSALPARSIDYVVLNNLNASEGSTPTKPTTVGNPKLKS
jgi:hypothetical protein